MNSGVGFDGQGKEMDGTLAGKDHEQGGTQGQRGRTRQPQDRQPGTHQQRTQQRRARDLWAAGAGLVAVGTAVVLGELTASLVSPTVSPVTAVGGAVIDTVPPGVKEWVISVFGTADKVALLAGMALVIAALAALSGVLEVRRRFAGVILIAVFGAVGLVAVLSRPDLTTNAIPVPVLVALVGIALLRWLIRKLLEWKPAAGGTPAAEPASTEAPAAEPAPTEAPAQPVSTEAPAQPEDTTANETGPARRRFLLALGGTAGVAAVAGVLASTLRGAAAVVTDVRSRLVLPAPAAPAPPVPAGAEIRLDGLGPLVTPNNDFYRIDTALRVPLLEPDKWTLKVTGLVEREIELDFATLLAKPLTERYVTIACVSNEVGGDLIGNARWLGWPVRELLAMAGPKPGADMVLSRSTDGWTAGTPLEALTDSRDALLVVGMNGEPLPLEHGFPVRLIVPGLYGYVSATKWVTELKVTRYADDVAYWTPRGWSERGPIKTSSRIDVPRDGTSVDGGDRGVRRRRVGPAHGHRQGGAAGQRRRLASGRAGPGHFQGHLVPVEAGSAVDSGTVRGPGPGHHPRRRTASRGAGPRRAERGHRLPHD